MFETLCKVNHLVVDKTGTLTHGDIEISQTTLYGGFLQGDWNEKRALAIAAELEAHANHPIARAFRTFKTGEYEITNIENIIGSGVVGMYQGQKLKIGSATFVLGSNNRQVKTNSIYLSIDDELVATFGYHDPIRKESQEFIEAFKAVGIKVTLLTGDSLENAEPVAKAMGIEKVVAGAKPQDKLDYLNQLPDTDVTMMLGDGINDAPTLAGAHLSVAMGGGTDVAKASADMVLLGDRLNRLLEAREMAIQTRKIIRENLAWSLGYNLFILPLAVAGLIAPYFAALGMSASSVVVVSNSLRLLKEKEKGKK